MTAANIGGVDRALRIVAGVALLGLVALGPARWWGLIGVVPLATGLVSFCPLYRVFGFRTCPAKT